MSSTSSTARRSLISTTGSSRRLDRRIPTTGPLVPRASSQDSSFWRRGNFASAPVSNSEMARRLGSCVVFAAGVLLVAQRSSAQPSHAPRPFSALRALNNSVEALVRRVSPSVVQVVVTGYGPRGGLDSESSVEIVRQVTVGSGVILDPDGYIVTNAHVVDGAVRLQVVLSGSSTDDTPARLLGGATKTFDARIVGTVKDIYLAILNIDAANLIPLTIGDYDTVRTGDIVFALGSP